MKESLQKALQQSLETLRKEGIFSFEEPPNIEVSFPKDESFGDYTSNVAMVCAKFAKMSPLEIAQILKERLEHERAIAEYSVEIAAPGYLNFSYTSDALSQMIRTINVAGARFGESNFGAGVSVNLEFISANPTGPLHLGNGRGGFCGDALANILQKVGFQVTREYYVNDAGEQIAKLGHSVLQDAEAVYGGEYIQELHSKLGEKRGVREVGIWAAEKVLAEYIQKTLVEKMHISFDRFISERKDVIETGYVDRAVEMLRKNGHTFEQDGALWFRTTDFGDDKDRVLVKANGERTYLASDCGYILHKKERGFDRMIEIWGADHHGYVARFRAASEALGFQKENVRFILVQLVRLMKDGKEVRMSKRTGNVVSIDELIDAVGMDVARFFFLLYSSDTHMNFDMGLAEERSEKNPVYYVQYAHARMASILRKADEQFSYNEERAEYSQYVFDSPKEKLLIQHVVKFPDILVRAAEECAPHHLPQYAIRLADIFHSFYNECLVIDLENIETTQARLSLVRAAKTVLSETLRLMGVSAPEKM